MRKIPASEPPHPRFARPLPARGERLNNAKSFSRRDTRPPRHCERSEAIQSFEPQGSGLLRRFAPRNDEIKIRSRDALRPRLANHEDDSPPSSHDPEKWCPVFGPDHAQERGERSAERRIQPMSAPHNQMSPPDCARGAEARQKSGRARLPALHCGSRQGFDPLAQLQAMLPGTRSRRALPALSCPSPGTAPPAPAVVPA